MTRASPCLVGRTACSRTSTAANGTVTVPTAQGNVYGAPGITTFSFGGNSSAPQTRRLLHELMRRTRCRGSRRSGSHRVKAGADLTLNRSNGGLPGNRYGTYAFNSLSDLAAGAPASFTRTLVTADDRSGSLDESLYLGDAWRTGPTLQLIYGFRIEQSRFYDRPAFNAAVQSEFGIRNDAFPIETRFVPRVGFTYFHGATDKKPADFTLRGGIGLFRGSAQGVTSFFSGTRDATGLPNSQIDLHCVGSSVPPINWADFSSDGSSLPTACVGADATTVDAALPRVMLIDRSFQVPRTLRASLAINKQIAKIWSTSLEVDHVEWLCADRDARHQPRRCTALHSRRRRWTSRVRVAKRRSTRHWRDSPVGVAARSVPRRPSRS